VLRDKRHLPPSMPRLARVEALFAASPRPEEEPRSRELQTKVGLYEKEIVKIIAKNNRNDPYMARIVAVLIRHLTAVSEEQAGAQNSLSPIQAEKRAVMLDTTPSMFDWRLKNRRNRALQLLGRHSLRLIDGIQQRSQGGGPERQKDSTHLAADGRIDKMFSYVMRPAPAQFVVDGWHHHLAEANEPRPLATRRGLVRTEPHLGSHRRDFRQ
jgi:hypothetical protein